MKKLLVILFIIITLAADLKVTVFPYIHWVAWLLLIFPLLIIGVFKKGIIFNPLFFSLAVLLFSGMILSFSIGAGFGNLVQIIKFFLILLTLYYFLYYSEITWKEIVYSINIALIINFIFLLLGLIGFSTIASLMTADGRWGTLLAYPGSLVKIGVLGFYINIMSFLILKEKKVELFILILISIFIIYMDGSRTGMLILSLSIVIIYGLFFIINFKDKLKIISIPLVLFGIMIFIIPFYLTELLQSRIAKSILNLITGDSILEGLSMVDSIRFNMLKDAIEKIYQNPFIGEGAFTTVAPVEDGSMMVVHNTYLQFWGDYGIISFLGFFILLFSWIFLIPKIMYIIQINNDNKSKVLISFSILMLCYFNLNGLFHPYSTELSEWIIFIIPFTFYYNYYKENIIKGG